MSQIVTMFEKTAFDLWRDECKNRPIITLCKKLDQHLDNGIRAGIITEFCGPPGSGKTQMCIQLCVNVQFPEEIGGVGGKAIYIDTNQDFNPLRLSEIAERSSARFEQTFGKNLNGPHTNTLFTTDSILENVQYIYCKDYIELLGAIERIRNILQKNDDIKLIVIDSMSFHFRSFEDTTDRTKILYEILTSFQILADLYNVAVVVTNEVTTRFNETGVGYVCPALGDSHSHKIGQRIILSKDLSIYGQHLAYLEKSFHSVKLGVPFKITSGGIRGI